jgi:hypothetical protein
MKTKKHRLEQFLFYDYTGIEKHLERMALKGWKLYKITRLFWEYHRIKPQKLTYTVTYFSEASEFNPYPTENQRTFHAYCKDVGWDLAAEWAQMQIFCTERENPTPIETDESVKLKAIHRAMKKNFLPSSILLLPLYLLQVYLQLHMIADDPVGQLSLGSSLFLTATWSVLIIQTLFTVIGYFIWYRKSWKAVGMGGACAESSSGYRKTFCFFAGFVIVLLALAISPFVTSNQGNIWGGVLVIINMAVIIILTFTIKNALKRAEVSRKVNLAVTAVCCVILSIVLTGATGWCITRGISAGWLGNRQPNETYTITRHNGSTYTWNIFHNSLPLKVEDLQNVDYDHYSYEWTERESFLLAQYIARQSSFPDGMLAPELNYSIVDVKLPCLFDLCLNDYLNMYNYDWKKSENNRRYFQQTDAPAWQADAVYQLYQQDEAREEYVLCWDSRIVYINLEEEPTVEQINIITEKLDTVK